AEALLVDRLADGVAALLQDGAVDRLVADALLLFDDGLVADAVADGGQAALVGAATLRGGVGGPAVGRPHPAAERRAPDQGGDERQGGLEPHLWPPHRRDVFRTCTR